MDTAKYIRQQIEQYGPLLADGAMGTNLMQRGLISGDAPELWNVDCPEKILSVHDEFVEAGSSLLLTNSFGCNQARLKLHNAAHRVAELNAAAVEIARKAAEKTERKVFIAGSIGPLGELLEPIGAMAHDEAFAIFREQAEALSKADLLWVETMSSEEEASIALEAASTTNLPVVVTMSFDTAGKTMMGVSPVRAAEVFCNKKPLPFALGINCGLGATEAMIALRDMKSSMKNNVLTIIKSNCGVPEFKDGAFHHNGTPELMASYAAMARDAGAHIIGGCCGSDGTHLRAMAKALQEIQPGQYQDFSDEQIIATLGALARPIRPKNQKERSSNRRGRRR